MAVCSSKVITPLVVRGNRGHRAALDQLVPLDQDQLRQDILDSMLAEIFEPRSIGGLTIEDTGAVVHVSPATDDRQRAVEKAWLNRELTR